MIHKKIYGFGRVLLAFMPASYFTNLFYRDFFIAASENKLLFLVWAFPCLHLFWVSMQVVMMLTGRRYRKYEEFSVIKACQVTMCDFFPKQVRFDRFFFTIEVGERKRVVSGVFWHSPTFILTYENALNKLKTLTLGNFVIMCTWILANLIVSAVLRFFIL